MIEKELLKKIENREKVILYHGSRGGINGDIKPASRSRCDFGKGFYMGTNPEQAKSLVVEQDAPVFYTVEFDFSKIPLKNILILDGQDWLYTVLAFRKRPEELFSLPMVKECMERAMAYDVVIGAIADDRMNFAVQAFSNYALTDKGLAACLLSVNYGNQIVAKTKRACEAVNIVSSRDIFGKEADDIRKRAEQMRRASYHVVAEMKMKYQRDGIYLNEIIEQKKNAEYSSETGGLNDDGRC